MARLSDLIPANVRWRMSHQRATRFFDLSPAELERNAKRQFFDRLGYEANLSSPSTHSEHILLRKVRDRDARFARLSDKYAARAFHDERFGVGFSDRHCVPVLAKARRFRDLPDTLWSQDIILKSTHASGWNIVVPANDAKAKARARKLANRWMTKVYGWQKYEWAYLKVEPALIAEPLLAGGQILDIKLYFYDGVLRFIMPEDNSGPRPALTVYDTNWQPLDMSWAAFDDYPNDPPDCLDEIIALATPLPKGLIT